jgi:ATP-dependent Clp protease, protease subunit
MGGFYQRIREGRMALPPTIYATFVGVITQESVGRMIAHIDAAGFGGARDIHIFFQSIGGVVGDGIALFNYFDASPIQIHLYNPGAIESAAVIAYLGARHRYATSYSTFLIHPSTFLPPSPMGAEAHRVRGESLSIDDKRTRAIMQARTSVPPRRYARFDLTLTAQEAINFGIAQSIRDFKVPAGNQVYDLTQRIA